MHANSMDKMQFSGGAGAKTPPAESAKGTPEPEARASSVARGESEAPGGEAGNAGGGGPSAERGGSAAPSEAGKKGDLEDEKMSAAAAKERNLKRAETIRYLSLNRQHQKICDLVWTHACHMDLQCRLQ